MEVIRAAYHLESPLPHGPRVVGVEGLEELLQKIGREEQERNDFSSFLPHFYLTFSSLLA